MQTALITMVFQCTTASNYLSPPCNQDMTATNIIIQAITLPTVTNKKDRDAIGTYAKKLPLFFQPHLLLPLPITAGTAIGKGHSEASLTKKHISATSPAQSTITLSQPNTYKSVILLHMTLH